MEDRFVTREEFAEALGLIGTLLAHATTCAGNRKEALDLLESMMPENPDAAPITMLPLLVMKGMLRTDKEKLAAGERLN